MRVRGRPTAPPAAPKRRPGKRAKRTKGVRFRMERVLGAYAENPASAHIPLGLQVPTCNKERAVGVKVLGGRSKRRTVAIRERCGALLRPDGSCPQCQPRPAVEAPLGHGRYAHAGAGASVAQKASPFADPVPDLPTAHVHDRFAVRDVRAAAARASTRQAARDAPPAVTSDPYLGPAGGPPGGRSALDWERWAVDQPAPHYLRDSD